jgi:hypothetical protein
MRAYSAAQDIDPKGNDAADRIDIPARNRIISSLRRIFRGRDSPVPAQMTQIFLVALFLRHIWPLRVASVD